jgi:hypothetical protein
MLSRVSWCERVIADPANFMLRMMERQGGQSTGCSSQTCGQKQECSECKFALERDLDSYAVGGKGRYGIRSRDDCDRNSCHIRFSQKALTGDRVADCSFVWPPRVSFWRRARIARWYRTPDLPDPESENVRVMFGKNRNVCYK